ncbi:RHS repeat-associated core domain-containing protein, partial [Burkholderia sp. ABCPW 14]|uniref:RHS repeat-associated core domain-containing protein n=1 Tax=Burkholderia sp. ABCPW 14 TaxID=1637860 RepID=UPI000A6FE720
RPAVLNGTAVATRQRGPRAPAYLRKLLSIAPPFKRGFTPPSTNGSAATQFLYDGANAVQETQGNSINAILTGLAIDERFARNDVTGRTYFLTDMLNSTIALADPSGAVKQRYSYDPYGNVTPSDTTTGFTNPYQFTGREADAPGLYYYRARYYSPLMMGFISEDPITFGGGQLSFYAYVGGNPLSYVDPFGLDTQFGFSFSGSLFALVGGASGSFTIGITTDGTLCGTHLFTSEQANGMAGLGLYAGVGMSPLIGHTNGPLQPGPSGLSGYIEGDIGAGEAASGSANFDLGGNVSGSGGYPAGPGKFLPGAGMGLMVGIGVSKSWTQVY